MSRRPGWRRGGGALSESLGLGLGFYRSPATVLVVCGLNSLKFWKNLGFTTKKRLKTTILNSLEFLLIFVNLTEKLRVIYGPRISRCVR